jgi:major vault protein
MIYNRNDEVEIGGDSFKRENNTYACSFNVSNSSDNLNYFVGSNSSDNLNYFVGSNIHNQVTYPKNEGENFMAENARENDLVLTPNEFAYVCDTNTGNVNVVVGPKKETLTNTDKPMRYDEANKEFVPCRLVESIKPFIAADEQSYIILKNPVTKDGKLIFPNPASLNKPEKLEHGRRVNINGPINFPLWPGQVADVLTGHQLRSNQYLVVKVINAEEAEKNIQDATIQTKEISSKVEDNKTKTKFVTGQLIIIKGTNVSFYIPPTGMEVVPDENGKYVREALTLERLEYCVLKDENGSKRYERGPAVVFPNPTEEFISRSGGSNIFKAVELNENMGLYIKVISEYKDPNGHAYINTEGKEVIGYEGGDELFISGKEQKIYFPRPEHAIIKYGKQIIHYAVAIPEGDARYVLNKNVGSVKLVHGPAMFLPDPRKEVIVKRILDNKQVALMFPGNKEALEYNTKLAREIPSDGYLPEADVSPKKLKESAGQYSRSTMRFTDDSTLDEFADGLKRLTEYSPPRSITLDNKYEGAVLINVWPGYAIQVMNKKGERRVVKGPNAILLEYDETLEKLTLSTGRPKSDNAVMETSYLHVRNNKVSDKVYATTSDLVDVEIEISYRVNFEEGKESKWFSVQNYIKFLTDHLRSIIRNAVKKYGIEEFNANSIDIIRDTVLGKVENEKRPGKLFEENGMLVYDVEVLFVRINDKEIERILIENQHKTVQDTIALIQSRKLLEIEKQTQEIARQINEEKKLTDINILEAETEILKKRIERDTVETEAKADIQTTLDSINNSENARKKVEDDRRIERLQKQSNIITEAHEKRMAAITPNLIEAINSLGDKNLAQTLVENLPRATSDAGAIFGIGALENVIKMVAGTKMEKSLRDISSKFKKIDIDPERTPTFNEESDED